MTHVVIYKVHSRLTSHLRQDYEGALVRVLPPGLLHPELLLEAERLRPGELLQLLGLHPLVILGNMRLSIGNQHDSGALDSGLPINQHFLKITSIIALLL